MSFLFLPLPPPLLLQFVYLAIEVTKMQASNFPTEKVDAETAPRSQDTDILQPLQFLMAARRGVKMDPSFSGMNIPEDRHLGYTGDSGFKSQRSGAPLWTRFTIWLGYMNSV